MPNWAGGGGGGGGVQNKMLQPEIVVNFLEFLYSSVHIKYIIDISNR